VAGYFTNSMIIQKPATKALLQKILNEECPGVTLHIRDGFDDVWMAGTELRFNGPTTKSVWVYSNTTVEELGKMCRAVIDEFISEARALDAEHLAEIYNYDS